MLVVYLNAVHAVSGLNFSDHAFFESDHGLGAEDILRINGTRCNGIARVYGISVLREYLDGGSDNLIVHRAFGSGYRNNSHVPLVSYRNGAFDIGDDVICRIGLEDKKLLLFDNFTAWDEGELKGEMSPETKKQLRTSN